MFPYDALMVLYYQNCKNETTLDKSFEFVCRDAVVRATASFLFIAF